MTKTALALSLLVALSPTLVRSIAQSPSATPAPDAKSPTFEVATIKPSDRPGKFPWSEQPSADGMAWMNVSLQYLVREAYGVTDDKRWSGGPAWLDTQRFDIVAKFQATANPNPSVSQRMLALRALLADRFALKLHRESKDFPVYNLVVAKDGPKLQASAPEADGKEISGMCTVLMNRAGITKRHRCSMANLAEMLRYSTGRTVLDKTALSGSYDYELDWAPDNTPADSPLAAYPSIFTALQEQLGLKLVPATAPLDILVVDSAEKPTPN